MTDFSEESKRKMKILVSAPLHFLPDLQEKIESEFDTTLGYGTGHTEIQSLLQTNAFQAWMVSPCPTYEISKELVSLCPSLKIIATPSTGSNHLDVQGLGELGIAVFTLKGTDVVENIFASSEFSFNLLISVIRKTPYAFQAVREGKWRESESQYRGRELNGLSLGVIGYGRIGRNLSKYSNAFGMKILAYDPYVQIQETYVKQFDNLHEMLNAADAVAVCVHLNDETYKMINGSVFSQMRDGVYFINTSRGDVIDEAALIKNLESGKVLAAGVDVISNEFLGDKNVHPLIKYARSHDNLIITPHIAGLTYDSERKAQTAAYIAIKNHLSEKA